MKQTTIKLNIAAGPNPETLDPFAHGGYQLDPVAEPAERHLTKSEQLVMQRALLRSTRLVELG